MTRQPDDPIPDDYDARSYAPLRFESSGFGREVVMLGAIMIGEIMPHHGRFMRVGVLFRLPGAPRTMFTCNTVTAAKHKCAEQTREWMEAAGLRT